MKLSLLNSVDGFGSVGAWVAWVRGCMNQILVWVVWVHKISVWVKKGRGSKFCMHDVDDVKFWRGCSGSIKYWQGAKSCIGSKTIFYTSRCFPLFSKCSFMYSFLTFVSLYSLCSFHIHSNWGRTKIIYRP